MWFYLLPTTAATLGVCLLKTSLPTQVILIATSVTFWLGMISGYSADRVIRESQGGPMEVFSIFGSLSSMGLLVAMVTLETPTCSERAKVEQMKTREPDSQIRFRAGNLQPDEVSKIHKGKPSTIGSWSRLDTPASYHSAPASPATKNAGKCIRIFGMAPYHQYL